MKVANLFLETAMGALVSQNVEHSSRNREESGPSTSPSLINGLRTSNEEAWRRFVDVYSPLLSKWLIQRGANVCDVDEISQRVFINVHRSISTFERLPGKNFRGWLRTISKHLSKDIFLEKRKLFSSFDFSEECLRESTEPYCEDENTNDGDSITQGQVVSRVVELIRSEVSKRDWEIMQALMNEMQPCDVAEAYGMSTPAVRMVRVRFLKSLKMVLKQLGEDCPQ